MNYLKLWQNTLNNLKKNKLYTIICPPPNVTGNLHIGHCVTFSLIDIIARYKIFQGFYVNMIGGTDHAANATTIMVRKHYGNQLTKENFQDKAIEWIENAQSNIINQLKDLGLLMNWNEFSYTMDKQRNHSVITAFNLLYNKNLIYKAKKMVNWDTHFGTAIADLEVNMITKESILYQVKYWLEDDSNFIIISTTRPETIFADCAIAIAINDSNKHYLLNKKVKIPIINKLIPIILSDKVDKDFGTGFLKITPAHSIEDYNIWQENITINTIEPIDLMDNYGIFSHDILPQNFQGLNVYEARQLIVKELSLEGKTIKNHIPISDRSETVVEWKITEQWFFDVQKFKTPAMNLLDEKIIKFWPSSLINNYKGWINNLQSWCISRDLPLGHQIPIWYDNYGNQWVGHNSIEAENKGKQWALDNNKIYEPMKQDHHVLDTWFSSGLFYKSSLNWPNIPTNSLGDLIVTGYDILFFWITRMILMAIGLDDPYPFKNVLFHGLVRDKLGNKMSKTKGNTINPYEMAHKFSWDNLRLTIALNSINNNDLKLSEDCFIQTNKIITKLNNAHSYCNLYFDYLLLKEPTVNHMILNDMINSTKKIIGDIKNAMDIFEINKATKLIIHQFLYHNFCDHYIEFHKIIVKTNDKEANHVLSWIFSQLLMVIHILCPFVTEDIFQKYHETSLLNYHWCSTDYNQEAYDRWDSVCSIINLIRYFQQVFFCKNIGLSNPSLIVYQELIHIFTKTEKIHKNPITYTIKNNSWILGNITADKSIIIREKNKIIKQLEFLNQQLTNEKFLTYGDKSIIESYGHQQNNYNNLKNILDLLDQ